MATATTKYGDWFEGLNTGSPTIPLMLQFCNGMLLTFKWSQIETSQNVWDWSLFDQQVNYCITNNKNCAIMVWPGQYCPIYIFNAGVPQVKTTGDGNTIFPYYLNSFYTSRYTNMLNQVAAHLATYPDATKAKITHWQIAEGSTGDAVPWHGDPQPAYAAYDITDDQWSDFRRSIWLPLYNTASSSLPFLKLLFNGGDRGMDYQWIVDNMPTAWQKAGDVSHDYSFPGEGYYIERLTPSRLSASGNNRWRGEIDSPPVGTSWWSQSTNKNTFALVNSCLHMGLDIFNIFLAQYQSNTSSNYAYDYFNSKAAVRLVSETDTGWCQFRDVLDLTDTDRFPENVYGNVINPSQQTAFDNAYNNLVSKGYPDQQFKYSLTTLYIAYYNPARQAAIQAAFPDSSFAAFSVTRTGDAYNNDFNIFGLPDNYYRFLTQYDPNGTSKGYWRIGSSSDFHGRYCRGFDVANGKDKIYMIADPGLVSENSYTVKIRVTYYNSGSNQWALYYWDGSAKVSAGTITHTGTNTFVEHEFDITDFVGGGNLDNGADYTIEAISGDSIFSQTELQRISQNSAGVPPVANAGSDIFVVLPTSTCVLNGSASTGGSGTITAYLWELISGASCTIASPSSSTSNVIGLDSGSYIFKLTVTNNNGLANSDTVNVFVSYPDMPTVDAGADITVQLPTTTTTLKGSGTGSNVTHVWTKMDISPSGGAITSPSDYQTGITGLSTGLYFYLLTVTDEFNRTVSDSVSVNVIASTSGGTKGKKRWWFSRLFSSYTRVMRSTIISARESVLGTSIPTALQIEAAYADHSIAVKNGGLFYKIESATGNLVGYFVLQVSNMKAIINQIVVCPPFQKEANDINEQINNFIISNQWQNDYL